MTMMPPPKPFPVAEKEELNVVLRIALVKYCKYPGVLAVAVGVKYRNRQATDEVGIVFFVEK